MTRTPPSELRRVLVTGSEGTVGKAMTGRSASLSITGARPRLRAEVTGVDARPQKDGTSSTSGPGSAFVLTDLGDESLLDELLRGHDTVVHAAWANEGILDPDSFDPQNLEVSERILAVAAGIGAPDAPKIVLLSTVNTHVPADWLRRREARDLIGSGEQPVPHHHHRGSTPGPGLSRYGQSKVTMERLAGSYAEEHGLDVTTPRLGAVNDADEQPSRHAPGLLIARDPVRGRYFDLRWEDAVRLQHVDLVAAMQRIVDRDKRIGHFARYNLVSDNPDRVHLLDEPLPF